MLLAGGPGSSGGYFAPLAERILRGATGCAASSSTPSASARHTSREIRRLVDALLEQIRQTILEHEAKGTVDFLADIEAGGDPDG